MGSKVSKSELKLFKLGWVSLNNDSSSDSLTFTSSVELGDQVNGNTSGNGGKTGLLKLASVLIVGGAGRRGRRNGNVSVSVGRRLNTVSSEGSVLTEVELSLDEVAGGKTGSGVGSTSLKGWLTFNDFFIGRESVVVVTVGNVASKSLGADEVLGNGGDSLNVVVVQEWVFTFLGEFNIGTLLGSVFSNLVLDEGKNGKSNSLNKSLVLVAGGDFFFGREGGVSVELGLDLVSGGKTGGGSNDISFSVVLEFSFSELLGDGSQHSGLDGGALVASFFVGAGAGGVRSVSVDLGGDLFTDGRTSGGGFGDLFVVSVGELLSQKVLTNGTGELKACTSLVGLLDRGSGFGGRR